MELYNKKGEKIGYEEAVKWWLEHYRGMEHFLRSMEMLYVRSVETWKLKTTKGERNETNKYNNTTSQKLSM